MASFPTGEIQSKAPELIWTGLLNEPERIQALTLHLGHPVVYIPIDQLSEYSIESSQSVVFYSLGGAKGELKALDVIHQQYPELCLVLIFVKEDGPQLKEVLNSRETFTLMSWPCDANVAKAARAGALNVQMKSLEQVRWIRDVKSQNLKLEQMTGGLEKVVLDRTQHIFESKVKIENQVNKLRGLNRFVKELSGLVAVEEVLMVVRKESRRFHSLKEPILAFVNAKKQYRLLYFQGTQVLNRTIAQCWPQSVRLETNDQRGGRYLANELSRPFAKILSIPLLIRPTQAEEKPSPMAMLYFEHSFTDEELESFIDFIGERLQALSIALDRILLEFELKEASLTWERTFDGIQDPIAILDVDKNLLRANKSFGTGVVHQKCFERFVDGTTDCQGCPVPVVIGSGEKAVGEVRRGDQVYKVHSYPIELGHGSRPVTLVNHYVDVTQEQQLQSRVIQNEKMAAIGHLAGNIAHELNNPLTGIRSLAQILLKQLPDERTAYSDLIEVENAAQRCQLIIENLLEFSQGDSEQQKSKVSLNEVVERTLPLLKTAMRYYNCDFRKADKNCEVLAEPQLIQQVVFNLVNNACQAMGEKGTITIETKEESDSCLIRITDTGSGIPEDIRSQIFDSFFTTKKDDQGTGLGLSMSQSIVNGFGGEIELQSEVGHGSIFTVRLPKA